jgi:hypothetical protein
MMRAIGLALTLAGCAASGGPDAVLVTVDAGQFAAPSALSAPDASDPEAAAPGAQSAGSVDAGDEDATPTYAADQTDARDAAEEDASGGGSICPLPGLAPTPCSHSYPFGLVLPITCSDAGVCASGTASCLSQSPQCPSGWACSGNVNGKLVSAICP